MFPQVEPCSRSTVGHWQQCPAPETPVTCVFSIVIAELQDHKPDRSEGTDSPSQSSVSFGFPLIFRSEIAHEFVRQLGFGGCFLLFVFFFFLLKYSPSFYAIPPHRAWQGQAIVPGENKTPFPSPHIGVPFSLSFLSRQIREQHLSR